MPMGALNSHSCFCAIVDEIKREWDREYGSLKTPPTSVEMSNSGSKPGTKNIVDDLILHARTTDELLAYFRVVLRVCIKYAITINLKKCRFFPSRATFVGKDITKDGIEPSEDKFAAFRKMASKAPATSRELRKIIGMFGFSKSEPQTIPIWAVRG